MMTFSFTKHPILHLIEDHSSLFDGIGQLVGIWKEGEVIKVLSTGTKGTQDISVNRSKNKIIDLMGQNQEYSWLDSKSLPFVIQESGIFEIDLFDEPEKTILLIRIENRTELNDLLLLYFDKDLKHLSLAKKDELKLIGDTKPMIANFYTKAIRSILKNAEKNKDLLVNTFNPNTENIIHSYSQLQEKYNALKYNFLNAFEKLVKSIYYKYFNEEEYRISLDDAVLEKLIAYNGDHLELEHIIKNSVSFIQTYYFGDIPKHLKIEKYLINTEVKIQNQEAVVSNNHSKTIQLLDELNDSVKLLINKGLTITGTNVGNHLPKAITNAGITDKLKNHKKKILILFEQYPNRWSELRQNFRPIQNVVNSQKLFNRKAV